LAFPVRTGPAHQSFQEQPIFNGVLEIRAMATAEAQQAPSNGVSDGSPPELLHAPAAESPGLASGAMSW